MLLSLGFDFVLEMIFVFLGCRCRPCAAVAVVKSSSMVVVCFSEPLMRRMSSDNLSLERLTPRLEQTVLDMLNFLDPFLDSPPMLCSFQKLQSHQPKEVSLHVGCQTLRSDFQTVPKPSVGTCDAGAYAPRCAEKHFGNQMVTWRKRGLSAA